MAGIVHRQNGEKRMQKQIGCMPSFLHIFDRQQILAPKRIHSAKRERLHSSTDVGASPETMSSGESPEFSKELGKPAEEDENGRPTVDGGDDSQSRRSGVIARLMGLEPLPLPLPLPSFDQKPQTVVTTPALRRSASEARVSNSKYIDGNNFQLKQPNQSQKVIRESVNINCKASKSTENESENNLKKLKIRGMDEQLNDLNTLKQILEVLQLKGLLRSTNRSNRDSHRNFVYDRNLHYSDESSNIHLKQWRSLASKVNQHRSVNNSGTAVNRSGGIPVRSRTVTPNRIESNLKSCNSITKRKPLSIEIERTSLNKTGSVNHSIINRSPGNPNLTEYSSVNSTTESQRSRWEDCSDGKRLLERCGNLLDSIAEMNRTTESSPVSVLDSGFDKDESSSSTHSIDFKATSTIDFEEDNWSPKITPTEYEEFISTDSDFIYISKILQASQHLQHDSSTFFSLEKQFHSFDHTSPVSKCHRKLVFDVISEILDRNRQLPPWNPSTGDSRTSIKQIWYEFLNIREMVISSGDDLLELIGGVLKKEFVEVKEWGEYPVETSEVILDTERLIFKDLVSEAIREIVEFSGECRVYRSRRKLVF